MYEVLSDLEAIWGSIIIISVWARLCFNELWTCFTGSLIAFYSILGFMTGDIIMLSPICLLLTSYIILEVKQMPKYSA